MSSVYLSRVHPSYGHHVADAVRELFASSGFHIRRGQNIVIKPNWVHHHNASGHGIDCLITHPSVLKAVLDLLLTNEPNSIVIGDAPVQGCDFDQMLEASGTAATLAPYLSGKLPISVRDFRLTRKLGGGWGSRQETSRTTSDYVRFNLGPESWLEPVSDPSHPFRVTMYDPRELERTHSPGNHQYLIARELLEADLVINMPKLKTHKKAGLTAALKNLVGANGHKSFLPHHRKGSTEEGGDCYPARSGLRGSIEALLDRANATSSPAIRRLCGLISGALIRGGRQLDPGLDVEGSWRGNDTVWRMVLDLQRLVHEGMPDGTLRANAPRTILHLTDAILAGEGEGPIAPEPLPLGVLTLSNNAAAADRVHAHLFGFDPDAIPAIAHASNGATASVHVNGEVIDESEAGRRFGTTARPSRHWQSLRAEVAC